MTPLALRTFAADSNPAGDSQFVGFSVPVGVRDGDLIIVGITLRVDRDVIPPDGWTRIKQSDPARAVSVVTFYKTALNEGTSWVFSVVDRGTTTLHAARYTGVALVYANPDGLEPVDASAAVFTNGGTAQAVAGVTAALDGEESVIFLGTFADVVCTPATGYREVARHAQTGGPGVATATAAHVRSLATAQTIAPFTVTSSGTAFGASMHLVLRPTSARSTLQDVRDRVVGALPRGADRVYDLTATGDYDKYYRAIAVGLKAFGFDYVDQLRLEVDPAQSIYKLPDWEKIFGLSTSRLAKTGTIPQRQARLVAAWRTAASAGSTRDEIRAAVAPVLGYDDPSQVMILETPRSLLTAAHSYAMGTVPQSIVAGPSLNTFTTYVRDDPSVSSAGARIRLNVTHGAVEDLVAVLTGPDGFQHTWPAGAFGSGGLSATDVYLYAKDFARKGILGTWTLAVLNSGAHTGQFNSADVFVEAIGRQAPTWTDGLGAAIYEWAVFVDPALVNHGAGGSIDFDALDRVLAPFSQAHCATPRGLAASDLEGLPFCIPDDSIPDRCIPG